jgi:hypothetical protein
VLPPSTPPVGGMGLRANTRIHSIINVRNPGWIVMKRLVGTCIGPFGGFHPPPTIDDNNNVNKDSIATSTATCNSRTRTLSIHDPYCCVNDLYTNIFPSAFADIIIAGAGCCTLSLFLSLTAEDKIELLFLFLFSKRQVPWRYNIQSGRAVRVRVCVCVRVIHPL